MHQIHAVSKCYVGHTANITLSRSLTVSRGHHVLTLTVDLLEVNLLTVTRIFDLQIFGRLSARVSKDVYFCINTASVLVLTTA